MYWEFILTRQVQGYGIRWDLPGVVGRVGRYDCRTPEGRGYGYLKKDLLDLTLNALTPIQERYTELMSDPTTLDEVLRPSTERAQTIAAATMERVRTAVGIG